MSDIRRIRWILFVVTIFIGSAFLSCREIKYSIWGESAVATIDKVRTSRTSSGRRSVKVQAVRYRFVEKDGTEREGKMNRDLEWKPPKDRTFLIDYLPGADGQSRLHGERAYAPVVIFLGSLVVMGFFLIKLLRQAYSY